MPFPHQHSPPCLPDNTRTLLFWWQLTEYVNSPPDGELRLWEISPYDVAVHKGDLHSSFPTKLFGTTGGSSTCVVDYDQFGHVFGVSSYAFGGARMLGDNAPVWLACGWGDYTACQGAPIPNPFLKSLPFQDLDEKAEVMLSDGGK